MSVYFFFILHTFIMISQKPRVDTEQNKLQDKIAEELKNPLTHEHSSYFMSDKSIRVQRPEYFYKEFVDSLYLQFTDMFTHPHCKLYCVHKGGKEHVKFFVRPIEENVCFGNLNFSHAYCMVQIRSLEQNHLVRILFSKENPNTCLVVCFSNCEWADEESAILKHADVDMNFPIVLGLIQTPTVAYLLQEYLVTGKITYPNPITFNNFMH